MDCKNCNKVVPYLAHEADMTRLERTIHRLWILVILLIATLVLTNIGWIMYEAQYEDNVTSTEEIQQEVEQNADGGGNNSFVGGDIYGISEDKTNG